MRCGLGVSKDLPMPLLVVVSLAESRTVTAGAGSCEVAVVGVVGAVGAVELVAGVGGGGGGPLRSWPLLEVGEGEERRGGRGGLGTIRRAGGGEVAGDESSSSVSFDREPQFPFISSIIACEQPGGFIEWWVRFSIWHLGPAHFYPPYRPFVRGSRSPCSYPFIFKLFLLRNSGLYLTSDSADVLTRDLRKHVRALTRMLINNK
jgi:hypothetical protein